MAGRERSGEDGGRVGDRCRGRRGVRLAALDRDRRRDDAGHPAGVDQGEVREVDRDVEGDPVIGDPTLDAQAERPDLPGLRSVRVAPAARVAVAPRRLDAERGTGRDERRLEGADERADEQAAIVEGDDRVGHELTRAVVGDLAAALDVHDRDTPSLELGGDAREDVCRIAVPAQRQDGRVLQQEELVADPPIGPLGGQSPLERMRLVIRDPTEPVRLERPGCWAIEAFGRADRRHRTPGEQVGLHRRTIAGVPR